MARQTIHVLPDKDGWRVERESAKRASKVCETKAEAIEAGKNIAKNQKAELVIHNKDGKISQANSYGNDPNPPKDRK